MNDSNILHSLFQYKAWTEEALFKCLKAPAAEPCSDAMEQALYWLAHINIVDQLFMSRLQGKQEEFDSVVTDSRQQLLQLEEAFARANRWFVEYTRSITPEERAERVRFTFKDGKQGDMTKEQILAHILSHGLQHRGSVATILPREILNDHQDHFTTFLKL